MLVSSVFGIRLWVNELCISYAIVIGTDGLESNTWDADMGNGCITLLHYCLLDCVGVVKHEEMEAPETYLLYREECTHLLDNSLVVVNLYPSHEGPDGIFVHSHFLMAFDSGLRFSSSYFACDDFANAAAVSTLDPCPSSANWSSRYLRFAIASPKLALTPSCNNGQYCTRDSLQSHLRPATLPFQATRTP